MFKWIKHLNYTYFHHTKLHKKLMISYSIIVIIPVIVLYFFSYNKIATILEHNMLFSATQNYDQAHSFASYKLYKMIRSSDLILSDQQLHRILKTDIETTSIVNQIDDMYLLQNYFTSFEDGQDIDKVRLYVPSDFTYSKEGVHFLDLGTVESSKWYPQLVNKGGNILFAPSEYLTDTDTPDSLAIIRPVYNLEDYNDIEGYMRIDFKKSLLLQIIEKSTPSINSVTLILNSKDDLILSSNDALLSNYGLTYHDLMEGATNTTLYNKETLKDKSYYIQRRLIKNTDWSIITVIPYDAVLSEINSQRQILLFALMVMLILAFTIAYLISYFIKKRLDILTSHMSQVDAGTMLPASMTDDQDEIGLLSKNYNIMLQEIHQLLEEKYESGMQIKSSELKALQAQINPHFLYNTLEMINWMAKKQEIDQILNVTKELSKFYKLSLNKGNDFITLRDEFAHLNAYINIQNLRFENKITFHQSLSHEIASFIVPKIILQPLVENAITHGILETDEQEGILSVEASRIDQQVLITVKDNGKGITPKRLSSIFDPYMSSDNGSHYGLFSIKERLTLYYGDQCNITVENQEPRGTKVSLYLPYNLIEKM